MLLLILSMVPMALAAQSVGEMRPYHNDIEGYVVIPENAENAPALILIHEWWGLNDEIRSKADRFAADGYVVLAVDLYGGESTERARTAMRLAGGVRKDPEEALNNLRAAAAYLRELPETDGERLGSVGWCFGGGWSYQIAKNDIGAKTSVIYYGRFNPKDDLSRMRTKIIGHFGEDDRSIRVSTVREFQAQLRANSEEHEIFIYPNAGHSFSNPNSSSYNEEAAERAYLRTINFLERHL